MATFEHYIYATFIGNPRSLFEVGKTYLLKVQDKGVGTHPILAVFDYAQYFQVIPYKSIVDFLKDWTEIVTTVPSEAVSKASKVVYESPSEEDDDELPFKEGIEKSPKLPVAIPSVNRPPILASPSRRIIGEGQWLCSACRHINSDINSFYCEECGATRFEFD